MSEVPKATLYTFDGSVWASAPRLALVEKGYASSDIDIKTVDLVKAENFDPSYLRINSKGTVPTLVVPLLETTSAEVATKFRAITDTKAILEFLDKSRRASAVSGDEAAAPAPILAPATIEGKAVSDEIIRLVHDASVDPNFLLLGARSEAELNAAKGGLPGTFVTNRNNALLAHARELESGSASKAFDGSANPKSSAIHENLKKWYANKIESQALLTSAYVNGDAAAIAQLTQATTAGWKAVGETLAKLETVVQGPFALGDQISLADLHVIPWLARLGAVATGLTGDKDPLASLNAVLGASGGKVGEKVRGLWTNFSERPSFKTVYGDGLH
ncbi:Glutathione S-transferase, N-terminal [Kalmanozyma brasiliensis GHG001]|uniref:GST N-terminal domain-containing protein n=1 Tax=Kalmanozyma brasiliensis (strain GHG001) TaxID=1365824 RepID=V5F096_KALBG|nr:Glutathione S-transferase, N-terminal [Kalmanozyma brasiliensis GHG001]EST08609.1 Glutathione S-transferase, N-terminal [Kalmanozyma brasiliensis GHG001]